MVIRVERFWHGKVLGMMNIPSQMMVVALAGWVNEQLMAKFEVLGGETGARSEEKLNKAYKQLDHPYRVGGILTMTINRKSLYNQQYGVSARESFGDTDVFPVPFEYEVLDADWSKARADLWDTDLTGYTTRAHNRILIPKTGTGKLSITASIR